MTPLELQTIDEATVGILAETGVRLEHDDVVRRMVEAGARPGLGPQDVRIPREMLAEYLCLAPPSVQLAARGEPAATLTPDGRSVFWTNPGLYMWTGDERREARGADLAAVARLCDHLDTIQGIMGMAISDVPPACRDFAGLRIIAENTRKHVRVLCFTPTGADALVQMKPVFPGPWFSIGFTAHGPLRWTHLALEIFRRTAGHGIPVTINGEPVAGVSGPMTIAGSIAVGNAEILAGIVVNQVLEPGRPVIYNLGLAHALDMRHATAITGGPENALFARASAALGRFYRLPSASWVSTDAVFEDEQAALEKMFGFQTHMKNGVSLIWGMGQLESEMTMSLGQLMLDDERIRYIRRFRRGYAVNAGELQLDLIRSVGIAGSYLESDHTLAHFREVLFEPMLLNRKRREGCTEPLMQAAHRMAGEIINADREEKITGAELAELRRVEEAFRARIANG